MPPTYTVTSTFNRASRPVAMASSYTDGNHPATLIGGLHYNAAGQEVSMQSNTGSGFQPFSEARCYSARGALEDVAVAASATVPSCTATSGMAYWLQLGLEPNQAPASANDSANGNWSYGYDDFNRIATAAGPSSYSFAYDRQGNRWQQNLTGGSGPAPSFTFAGGSNRMDGYSFDAAGNLLNDGRCSYSYDDENRAVAVGACASESFVYDAEGRRVRTASTGWDEVYDLAGHIIAEFSPGPAWARGEIYANGRQVATYANGTTYLNFADGLNTERTLYDVHGVAFETCQSLAFGDGLGGAHCGTGDDPSPLHFAGQYRDYTSGLDHMGARDYASALGRWTTPDPASSAAADPNNPQTWNRYTYVNNSPLDATDPTGLLGVADCMWDGCTSSCPLCQGLALTDGGGGGGGGAPDYSASFGTQGYYLLGPLVQQEAANEADYLANEVNHWGLTITWFGTGDKSILEQQTEAATIALGMMECSGAPAAITACAQNIYNNLEDQDAGRIPGVQLPYLEGGNYNWTATPATGVGPQLGCFNSRCGDIGSIHYKTTQTILGAPLTTFHMDTANPWSLFGLGGIIHYIVDVRMGNGVYSGGIPRNP
ncbi:MAG: RHS repeat-associated core domain-containing protein [Terriglobales bacterium]